MVAAGRRPWHTTRMRVRLWSSFVVAALAAAPLAAVAQPTRPAKIVKDPPPPPIVGATVVGELRPTGGYIDDGIAAVDGGVMAVVRANGGAGVTATTIGSSDGAVRATVDLSKLAPGAARLAPMPDGGLIVIETTDRGERAVVLDRAGKKVRLHKGGTRVGVRTIGGKPVIVTYSVDPKAKGGEAHAVALADARTGKKVGGKPARLVLAGADRRDARLDFRPIYFVDDMTIAVGVRGGVWRKAEDSRGPDTWAAYDLTSGKWVSDQAITDPMTLARRIPILEAHDQRVFARMADDLTALELWRDGVPTELTLDQPMTVYDPLSIQFAQRGDAMWLSLVVDPTNQAAVRRQKTDPRYLDLFEVVGDRAVRRARFLVDKAAPRWGFTGDVLWVLERHPVLPRGGAALTLYRLDG